MKKNKAEQPDTPISLRVPKEMRSRLQQLADADMRTLSNLILFVLKKHLDDLDAAPDADRKAISSSSRKTHYDPIADTKARDAEHFASARAKDAARAKEAAPRLTTEDIREVIKRSK